MMNTLCHGPLERAVGQVRGAGHELGVGVECQGEGLGEHGGERGLHANVLEDGITPLHMQAQGVQGDPAH